MTPDAGKPDAGEKPDFQILRLFVEQHSTTPVDQMTWVRFLATLRAAVKIKRMQRKGAESHAENIARQREANEGDDW
jgi:hypothetical protein